MSPLRGGRARTRRAAEASLADALLVVRDALRGGLSLAQAVVRAGGEPGSPLAPLAAELEAGRPLVETLEAAARAAPDPDRSMAFTVLAAHARSGGDPSRAVAGLESRLRARMRAARELRVLTAQARMSARVLVALTPGFLALLALVDPRGTWRSLTMPAARAAVAGGLLLQVAGGWWVGRIVSGPRPPRARTSEPRAPRAMASVPVLRVLLRPRAPSPHEDVAHAAELVALLLRAGLSPARAVELAAPVTPGLFGERLREAVRSASAGLRWSRSLAAACEAWPEARRWWRVLCSADELGVPVADALDALACELREERMAAAAEDARRASLKVLVPLALLILPAFVLMCLVPLLAGGLRSLPLGALPLE